jgi:hypothetical protein
MEFDKEATWKPAGVSVVMVLSLFAFRVFEDAY